MRRRHTCSAQLLALSAVVLALACSDPAPDDSGSKDTIADTAKKDTSSTTDDDSATAVNNWVQGYTVELEFHGSYADGKKVRVDRDLYDVAGSKQVFSFGSSHYSFGEIGFAMTESLKVEVDGKELPMEFQLNFGLVKGSSKNPVHVDKVGTYDFSCKAPEVRVNFMAENYRSTCAGLKGTFDITDWGNATGEKFRGFFEGKIAAYNDKPDKPDPCDAAKNKLVCKQPDVWATVKGHFGFTLPEKDG